MSNIFESDLRSSLVRVVKQKDAGLRSSLESIASQNAQLAASTSVVEATALEAGINQAFGVALSERAALASVRDSLASLDYIDAADITAFGSRYDAIIDASIPNGDTLTTEARDERIASVASLVAKAATGLAILNG